MNRIAQEIAMGVQKLPTVTIGNKSYFVDLRLNQLRNVNDPTDWIDVTRDQELLGLYVVAKARAGQGKTNDYPGLPPLDGVVQPNEAELIAAFEEDTLELVVEPTLVRNVHPATDDRGVKLVNDAAALG